MTRQLFRFAFFLLICLTLPLSATAQVVDIPDANLRAAVEAELGKASGDTITTADMANLTELDAGNANISDLTGLEAATNLTILLLWGNNISDISPLAGLTNLTRLVLWDNSISDIAPVVWLTNLTELALGGNNISDISPVAGLTRLTSLHLPGNNISDVSGVSGLTHLTYLNLAGTNITDLSFLSGLTNLTELLLQHNNISNLSPLVANTGLGSGDTVNVQGNPLNRASIETHIPALEGRGVTVEFFVLLPNFINIPDANLFTAIANALGIAPTDFITAADMANLTDLTAPNANISNLIGLEYATNLTSLHLGIVVLDEEGRPINSNSVSDLSPLAGLTNLTSLFLGANSISDISQLAGLTNLMVLGLSDNFISDISPVADLTNLIGLSLANNFISDISPVTDLTNLIGLSLSGNSISDISSLVENTGLGRGDQIDVRENPLSDVSIETHIPALESRGVEVDFIRTPTTLLKISGTVTASDNLLIVEVRDNRNSRLAGVFVTFTVISGGGTLSATSVMTDANGRAESRLTLGPETGTNRVSASVEGISESVTFSDVPEPPVDIPDSNLRAAIEAQLGKASGVPITLSDMIRLTDLSARNANITDLTGLEAATNLISLNFGIDFGAEGPINSNSVSDLSPLSGLTNLESLRLNGNSVTDISPVGGLINLTSLSLGDNSISDISAVTGLTNLTSLDLGDNSISDISPIAGLTNLGILNLDSNSISDISAVARLTNLTALILSNNSISDISAVARLTNLTALILSNNSISDISPVAGLTNLTALTLEDNSISNISAVAGLTNLTLLGLGDNSISNLSPLVENTGLGEGDFVSVGENPLNSASIDTHIPILQSRGVAVLAENLKPTTLEYTLSIPKDLNLIHVPLKVTVVNDVAETIESVSDLYDALGGAPKVGFLVTYDSQTQTFSGYFGPSDKGTAVDKRLNDDTGILANMIARTEVRLRGTPLGTNGTSTITLTPGFNIVGLPLRDSRINRVSDLLDLDGISGNVQGIILTDGGDFQLVTQPGDPSNIPIVGGQAFMLYAQREDTVTISGQGWDNTATMAAAPLVGEVDLHSPLTSIQVTDTTSVLGLKGSIVDEEMGFNKGGFRVTVKNLSTGKAVTAVTGLDKTDYRHIIVDIETKRAATVGDILEISAQSSHPLIGVEPLRYTVTAEDVKRSLIQLPELVTYEIPAETKLLPNYPNPFNPETWIPYRLAEDAFVTLTIYDGTGQVVRTIEVGHQTAAVYESRSKAVYWDGRNNVGETVASGVYFYHLSAGDYSATRKMLILK